MNVLGIDYGGHDPGAAIVTDQDVVAISEERLNGIKHSRRVFPHLAIDRCLEFATLKPSDIDLIVSTKNPFAYRYLERDKKQNKDNVRSINQFLADFKGIDNIVINHHFAHAASTYLCSPFDQSAIMTIDGAGNLLPTQTGYTARESDSLYFGNGNEIHEIHKAIHVAGNNKNHYHQTYGIGKLYAHISDKYLGFGPYCEGKAMGLSSFGNAENIYKNIPRDNWVREINGFYYCNPKIVWPGRGWRRGPKALREFLLSIQKRISSGNNRLPDSIYSDVFTEIRLLKPSGNSNDVVDDDYYADVAAVAQDIIEMIFLNMSRRLFNITQSENLCLAGGAALNGIANNKILEDGKFKNIFIQPASSDSGLPLGAALWGHSSFASSQNSYVMRSADLGMQYSESVILDALSDINGIEYYRSENIEKDSAKLIADGAVLGWFQGRSEYGPRSLGSRSILCDPRELVMKDKLNNKIKKREDWRPFGASVLLEYMSDFFEIESESPFMLYVPNVRPHQRQLIPALVHSDGTCRVQSVTKKDNGLFYDLIKVFYSLTGMPLIVNTSFNLAGNPIVETPKDALDCFTQSEMDYLAIDHFMIAKKEPRP